MRPARSLTAPLRQQRLPAARRRRQLLDVARELFGARGFHDTSMEEIAERAGVTKPVLYQHFPSKRQLYRELIETVGEEMLTAIASDAVLGATRYQMVLGGFRAYLRYVASHASAFQVLLGSNARTSEDFADVVHRFEDSVAGTISGFIDAGVDPAHRELLGYAIVGLAEVSARRWTQSATIDPETGMPSLDPADGELLSQQLADLVWAGLRSLPPA